MSIIKFFPKANLATIHWDSKMLPDLMTNEKVERFAIVLSQTSGVELLGVPKIDYETGECQAEAIFTKLFEWNLTVEWNLIKLRHNQFK